MFTSAVNTIEATIDNKIIVRQPMPPSRERMSQFPILMTRLYPIPCP